jgi:HSP20 family protein
MNAVVTGMPLPAPFLEGLRYAMERLADGPLAPALDLYTTPEAVVAKVALPGVNLENIDVTVGDDRVTISGSVKDAPAASDAGYVHRELSHGTFSRSFWLPTAVNAEGATASFQDGLLTLTLPKTEEVKTRRVKVEIGEI